MIDRLRVDNAYFKFAAALLIEFIKITPTGSEQHTVVPLLNDQNSDIAVRFSDPNFILKSTNYFVFSCLFSLYRVARNIGTIFGTP